MRYSKNDRQKIIDDYLAATGRNMFVPSEFVAWLEGQPTHPVYAVFFAKADAQAAIEYRIGLARRFASGLRIRVTETITETAQVRHIVTREYPALISPVHARRVAGGGYQPFDASDPEMQAELRRQAASALRSWLNRFSGAVEAAGISVDGVVAVVDALSPPLERAAE